MGLDTPAGSGPGVAMRSLWSGWMEMEWGEEEGAQWEQVLRFEARIVSVFAACLCIWLCCVYLLHVC